MNKIISIFVILLLLFFTTDSMYKEFVVIPNLQSHMTAIQHDNMKMSQAIKNFDNYHLNMVYMYVTMRKNYESNWIPKTHCIIEDKSKYEY